MSKPLRLLMVEDSEDDARLLLFELRKAGYEISHKRIDTAKAMDEALDEQDWDIILADYRMPEFDGLAALELLKAKGLDLPFIIVSGQIGEEVAVQAMKSGASDYIMKAKLARLAPAVERELREAEQRRERRKAEQERDRLMAQLRDVNEQVVMSSIRLQEQSDELEAIVTALAEAVVVIGPKGEIVRLNPLAASLLGYSDLEQAEHLMERVAQLRIETAEGKPFPLADFPAARALRGETVRGVTAVFYGASDGKPVWTTISAAPIRTADGALQGAVTVFTDVTTLLSPSKEEN